MKLLLHTCCGPCSVACVASLREEGITPTLFWYNPNIHPYTEYKARRDTLVDFAQREGLELIMRNAYGLREFIRGVWPDLEDRCEYCYRSRLTAAAEFAAAQGFDAFSTTLLISPYQRHDTIREVGAQVAAEHGAEFLYRDWRPYFRAGQAAARGDGMYMQKYCGCVFSEEERYLKKEK